MNRATAAYVSQLLEKLFLLGCEHDFAMNVSGIHREAGLGLSSEAVALGTDGMHPICSGVNPGYLDGSALTAQLNS